jgi:hypothetical protein
VNASSTHPDHPVRRRAATLLLLVVALACSGPQKTGSGGLPSSGMEAVTRYAEKLSALFAREFTVPAAVPRWLLGGLAMRLQIARISEQGDVLAYRVVKGSGNADFDAAGVALVRRFCSAEGGGRTLPWPGPTTLQYVNAHGIVVDLQGSLDAAPPEPAGPSTVMPPRDH